MQNRLVEELQRRMRDALPNEIMLRNLPHARIVIAARAADDDAEGPYSILDYRTRARTRGA